MDEIKSGLPFNGIAADPISEFTRQFKRKISIKSAISNSDDCSI